MKTIKKFFVKKYVDSKFDQINYSNITCKKKGGKKPKFYIIASKKKRGLFSLLLYVLNHLKFSKKKKLIPIIDLEIYKSIYNESRKIFNSYNAWDYYFNEINKYNIKDVYLHRKFLLSSDHNIYTTNNEFSQSLKKIFNERIKLKNQIKKEILFYKKKFRLFKRNKVLGIHFRGTDMKIAPNHPMPPTKNQILEKINYCKKKFNFNKIFLVTEDIDNYYFLKNKYGHKIITIDNFRSNKSKVFNLKIRKFHKYKMGKEALINGYLLSYCNTIISSQTGISDFAKFLNKDINFIKINNGNNSSSIFISAFLWKLKNFLPKKLGGF